MPLSAPLKNWSENITYSAQNIYYPTTVAEVQTLVKQCANITALGSKHCFNTIADNVHNLISLQEMNKVLELNVEAQTVTVEGGITYGALCPYLHENGFALHNLASLPHISIAGSCSTATHGSGIGNANLASAVRAIEIVTADGMLLQLSREKDADKFLAVVVGLGAFGIITKITLAIQPTFLVR